MSPTRLQGLWQWAHIFPLLSILCSGFYAAILPVLLLLLPEPIHVYCHETVFYLLLLAFQPIFLLDTTQHTSFCIHNCTSLKFPQFRLSRIGGTYQYRSLFFHRWRRLRCPLDVGRWLCTAAHRSCDNPLAYRTDPARPDKHTPR